ncbi:amino acid ABC transporter ATP-binding protein [Acidisphaera sp. L21]|uniref:amino acid ABC transporter ATP-binding protein n=1 Tax=Acidisphaera sp. L21 TaxID=1641851 RepID=UPI0030072038
MSFEVEKGHVAVIIGQSGSGKSTALRCVNRLERIDSGRIEVCGHAVEAPDLDVKLLRRDIGIVFQSYNLFPHLSVIENITLALRHTKKLGRRESDEIARQVLDRVGLADKAGSFPEQLSGGQQQRAAIARSLAMSPKVMLFDEVTSALDPQLKNEVRRVIEGLAAGGMTMILVTHEMGFARRVADKVILMHKGVVHEEGSASILTDPKTKELRDFLEYDL